MQSVVDLVAGLSNTAQLFREHYKDDDPRDQTASVRERLRLADPAILALAYGESFIEDAERRFQAVFNYGDIAMVYMEPTQIAEAPATVSTALGTRGSTRAPG
jgi:hypothetical protein